MPATIPAPSPHAVISWARGKLGLGDGLLDAVRRSRIGSWPPPRPADVPRAAKIRLLCAPPLFSAGAGVGLRHGDDRSALADVDHLARRDPVSLPGPPVWLHFRPSNAGAIAAASRPSNGWPGPRPIRSIRPPNLWRPCPTMTKTSIWRPTSTRSSTRRSSLGPRLLPQTCRHLRPAGIVPGPAAEQEDRRTWFSSLQMPWHFHAVGDHRSGCSLGRPGSPGYLTGTSSARFRRFAALSPPWRSCRRSHRHACECGCRCRQPFDRPHVARSTSAIDRNDRSRRWRVAFSRGALPCVSDRPACRQGLLDWPALAAV